MWYYVESVAKIERDHLAGKKLVFLISPESTRSGKNTKNFFVDN